MPIREAVKADTSALAVLYADAVRAIGPTHYTPEQVEAWAASARLPTFRRLLPQPLTLVAEDETGPTGFAGLALDGHVTALYVRPDRMRQGVASALLHGLFTYAATHGIERLYTEASAFSRPVFERFGFVVDQIEHVEFRGVEFERYRMVREQRESTP